MPRKKAVQTNSSAKGSAGVQNQAIEVASSFYARLCTFFRWLLRLNVNTAETGKSPARRVLRPNPFQMLRLGKKMIVVAAVDAGMISFFRFCQGSFDEWPMV